MNPQKNWNSFIEEALSSPKNHFTWLKSLSYLEYIGYRKMVKSLSYDEMEKDTFQHLSDEIQHSFMLRRMGDKLYQSLSSKSPQPPFSKGEQDVPPLEKGGLGGIYCSKIPQIAEDYFQSLDSKIGEWVTDLSGSENHRLSYLWTSYVIEKRAMKVYPNYFSKLISSPIKTTIQKIIKDESEHLSYLENHIQKLSKKYSNHSSDLFVLEDQLFSNYLEEMSFCLNACNL